MASNSAELLARLRLTLVPGIGPKLHRALVEDFGSAENVWQAPPSQWTRVPGIGTKHRGALSEAREADEAERQMQLCQEQGVWLLTPLDPRYPRLLSELPDPPMMLFVRGTIEPGDELAVALVGARRATSYGTRTAEQLASALTRAGLVVISGLARGIDAAAHRGALAAGGRTIAILGSGVLNIYPPEHGELAEQIVARGAVISESPPTFAPLAGTFPQRNRLISGWSLGVVVVEATDKSGALITARHAMEQGREVFAVPGRIDSPLSRGCHRLLRDGAKLVETADDVLDELGPLVAPTPDAEGRLVEHPAELKLNEIERSVLAAMSAGPTTVDEVVRTSGLETHRVLSTLSALEIRRLVRRLGGNLVARA